MLKASRDFFPKVNQESIDTKLEEAFDGTQLSEAEDAREMADWMRNELKLDVPVERLTGVTQDTARQILWNAFDDHYRPEMRRTERELLLEQLDDAWKNHLYSMDHLRSGVGLRGYAQEDPKIVFKREGMKEFDAMWEDVQDKVTDLIFRMEESEGFQQQSVWIIGTATHESPPSSLSSSGNGQSMRNQQDTAIAGSQTSKKVDPIRNRGRAVSRNDPCPCKSGKKYKNCCMKKATT